MRHLSDEALLNFSKIYDNPPFDFFLERELEQEVVIEEIEDKVTVDKKPKKNWKRVLGDVAKVLIVVALIFGMGYTLIAGTKQDMGEDNYIIDSGSFGVNPVWMKYGNSDTVNQLYATIGERGEMAVAYDIYRLACERISLSKQYAVKAKGGIEATVSTAVVKVMSNRDEQYYVLGEPELNANQLTQYSNQDITYLTDMEGSDLIASILQAAIVFGVRSYCDGEKVYEQRSKSLIKDENNEFIVEWADTFIELPKGFERNYEDGELREKTNFVVNTSTILEDTIKIERTLINNVYKYDISFRLDCSTTDLGSATYYEAEAIRRKLGKSAESLIYNYMDIHFNVYENGYMTYWETLQQWNLVYKIPVLGSVSGSAIMSKEENISYDSDDCEILNFLQV